MPMGEENNTEEDGIRFLEDVQEEDGHHYFQVLIDGTGPYLERNSVNLDIFVRDFVAWATNEGIDILMPEKWHFGVLHFDSSLLCTSINMQKIGEDIQPRIIPPALKPQLSFSSAAVPEEFQKVDDILDYKELIQKLARRKVLPVLFDGNLAFVIAPRK